MAREDVEYQMVPMPIEALGHVYPKMKRDFVSAELKPQASLRKQMKSGMETGWLLLTDGQEAGYAFVLAPTSVPFVLLDYLAVDRRGQGDGSAFLALLQEEYPQGILVEAEDVVPGDSDSENELRIRRMNFYQRAGFRPCSFECKIFGVRYRVHLWLPGFASGEKAVAAPTSGDTTSAKQYEAAAAKALDDIYRIQAPKGLHQVFVNIDIPDEGSA